ncbi:MAG: MFS transporter [Candidatus Lokiarchaeota archaeon]|nr:MFS transporter [Candidatus Lokiarchaeota archaeon]
MNETDGMQRSETTTMRKLNYSVPRISSSIVLGIEGFALFALYYLGYGVPSIQVGFAQAMGYLSVAVSQFFFGWISDAKYTKWGRRKPYILILAPLLGLSFIFLLLPGIFLPDLNDKNALFIWLLIWDIVFRACYAVTTPYQAWMAEQFPVKERPKVSQFQNIFGYVGNAIMIIFTLLILTPEFENIALNPEVTPILVLVPILIFGLLVIILYLTITFTMPTEPNFKRESIESTSLITNLKIIIKNKNYFFIVLMSGIASFAWSMITTVMLTFIDTVLGLSGLIYYIVAGFLIIGFIIFIYFWRRLIQTKGKKQTLLYLFIFAIFLLPTTLIGLIPLAANVIFGTIFILIIAAVISGWNLFPYIYMADLAEDDEKRTGQLKAGIYAGFPSIIFNIFQAIGSFIIGAILSLQDITVGALTYSLGLVLWGPICSLILIVAYFFTKKLVRLDFDWEKEK